MELCNGNGIGKIFSGIGKPMLMDKLTKERCLKKAGKLYFTRVLVEVSSEDALPHFLEIEYPQIGDKPARIGKLDVKYQWIPPQCSHYKTFGHTTVSCKVRPRTEAEMEVKEKRVGLGCNGVSNEGVKGDEEGFVTVKRRNKHVGNSNMEQRNISKGFMNNRPFQNRNGPMFNRFSKGNVRQQGGNFSSSQHNKFSNPKQQGGSKSRGDNLGFVSIKQVNKSGNSKPVSQSDGSGGLSKVKEVLVHKPPLNSKYNENFKPKAFDDQDLINKEEEFLQGVDEEFRKVVWPKLKSEFGLEPYNDDDDVESDNDGMADMMKPENIGNNGPEVELIGVESDEDWMSNTAMCDRGTGIVIGWDPNAFRMMLHSQILVVKNAPWTLLGDFNIILEPSERYMGSSSVTHGMEEFRECLCKIEVIDVLKSGLHFTWNKSPGNPCGLLKKLDRVMSNVHFLDKFPSANALFLPFVTSDHSPSVLCIPGVSGKDVAGYSMFSVVSKLKSLKKPLRKLKYSQGVLSANVKRCKEELCSIQSNVAKDPTNVSIRKEEVSCMKKFNDVVRDEELFLKQKSKVTWLSEGDHNTKYFYRAIKEKRNFVRY
ncbi:RNA-directed DNA polymerase, eukaryota, reverse transcriptase zinc-binding domain protein [Tanacetum coccineum]